MDTMSRGYGREELESSHLVNGIYDSGCISTPEIQSDLSILLGIDEICYSLVIGGFKVPRRQTLPLSEDIFFCDDKLSTISNAEWRTKVTRIENPTES